MYFESRAHAGQIIASRLTDTYRYEDCVVVAVNDGGVEVGEQIAGQLHCLLTMLLVEDIAIPGESLSFGGVSQNGNFTYNSSISDGEIEEYSSEYHGYLEEQKRVSFQKINRLLGEGGLISYEMLRDRYVFLVADGISDSATLDAVVDFLKPIQIKRLIIVTPVASVPAVDRAHMIADELHILDVKDNYISTDHYYEDNHVLSHEDTIAKINEIILNWH